MVITKELENKWCPANKKHFEDLGYKFTYMKDSIIVKFEDMPHNSDKFIEIKCDYCSKIFKKQIKKYYRGKTIIDKDCCDKCRLIKSTEARFEKYGTLSAYVNDNTVEKHKERYRNTIGKEIFEKIKNIFKERDYTLISHEYINNETPIEYICNKHKEHGKQSITWVHLQSGEGCYYCGLDKHKGMNNGNWNGGTTSLNHYLRHAIKPWIKDSLENSNYRCDISNYNGSLVVHHLNKNFKEIVEETLYITKLDIRQEIREYTQDELNILSKICLDLHYKYGLGVCIRKEYHSKFHCVYGVKNNTLEQYYEFKEKILNS